MLDDVGRLLREDWTDYADFLDQHRDEVATAGALAFSRMLDVDHPLPVPAPDAAPDLVSSLFEEIGRAQWQRGNKLTLLLSAYQTGARAAWQQIARIAVEQELPAAELALLADGLFGFVDQLSSASARGYVAEQSEAAAGRERARADLADLLLSGGARPSRARRDRSPRRLAVAAHRGRWCSSTTRPRRARPADPRQRHRLAADQPGRRCRPHPRATPSAPARRQRMAEQLAGTGAVVGPTVTLARLPGSVRMARIALRLRRAGVITDDPVFLDEHIDAVIVHQDDLLLNALESQVLAPLAGLPPTTRQRLEETLASWLRHMGDRAAVAQELHIHRQTVRYRLAQLHELFGDALTDPERRLPLVLALGWRPTGEPPALSRRTVSCGDHRGLGKKAPMARAVRFDRYGGPDVLYLAEVDAPRPDLGEVVVAVQAAAINPGEASLREGRLADVQPLPPSPRDRAPTWPVSSARSAPASPRSALATRCSAGRARRASHADYVVVPADQLVRKPPGAAVGGGRLALRRRRAPRTPPSAPSAFGPGDTVVVSAAAGGVGSLAVQLAKLAGARVDRHRLRQQPQLAALGGRLPPRVRGGPAVAGPGGRRQGGRRVHRHATAPSTSRLAIDLGVSPDRINTIVAQTRLRVSTATRTEGSAAASTTQVLAELADLASSGKLVGADCRDLPAARRPQGLPRPVARPHARQDRADPLTAQRSSCSTRPGISSRNATPITARTAMPTKTSWDAR